MGLGLKDTWSGEARFFENSPFFFVKVEGLRILAEDCAKEIGGMGQGGGWRGRLKEDKPSEDFIREFSVMI